MTKTNNRLNFVPREINMIILLLLINSIALSALAKTGVGQLICEYKTNPLGIDVLMPRLSWQLVSSENDVTQTAFEIRIADSPAKLNSGKLIWSTGKVNSSQSVNLVYNGPALTSMQQAYWQVRVWDNKAQVTEWSKPAFWEMGVLNPSEWKASWISFGQEKELKGSKPAQYFRKEFSVSKKVKSARIYITALGLYQLQINGEKVSSDLFTPGWTSYKKRLQYQTYDVTSLLKGQNAIGVILGDGWYRGNLGFEGKSELYGKKLALLLQLQIDYTDGSFETIGSDQSWKVTANGPIVESDIYNGELYDARLELTGWDRVGYHENTWNNAVIYSQPNDILIAQQGVPVKAIQEIKPIRLFVTHKDETVFDLGQNMVGWTRLKISGKKGDRITLKFAEVLDQEGNFYTDNLRKAKCTDVYILKGEGKETFEPHFTFHGFRYVKIEGLSVPPSMDQITGIVVHSDMKPTGMFSCSDTLINQLQHNIQWGQKGNFLDVPTDCPQRDERLGWTGDAELFSPTAAFNFDVAAFYTKWMGDFTADQTADGKVPVVIPDVLNGFGGSSVWSDASVIIPWTTYLAYGDRRILEKQYPCMKAWIGYIRSRAGAKNLWLSDWHYGDWLAFELGGKTENDLIASAYYFYSTTLLSKIAAIIGKKEDAVQYGSLANDIKTAFDNQFVAPDGQLTSPTQTAYVLALAFGLLPDRTVPKTADYLALNVGKFGHLTTGLVGTPLLCKALCATGHEALAFKLLNNKDYPSWLYPVLHGATTIWERWDGIKPDGTFQDATMNSFNHYVYGAIGEWLYQYVAGINIDPDQPGYKHVLLSPHPGGGLQNAKAEISTLYGKVSSSWKLENEEFVYGIEVPANTSATVTLPFAQAQLVKQNGCSPVPGFIQVGDDLQLSLGSGKYDFRYPAFAFKEKTSGLK